MFPKKLSVIIVFLFVIITGCDSQENPKVLTKGAVILDNIIIEHTPEKIKDFRRRLEYNTTYYNKEIPKAEVYHFFDATGVYLLHNEVDDIIITYVDKKIAHINISFKAKAKWLSDIERAFSKKFGESFVSHDIKDAKDINVIHTWGLQNNFYYKFEIKYEDDSSFLSIKSKSFMDKLGEERIDMKKMNEKKSMEGIIINTK